MINCPNLCHSISENSFKIMKIDEKCRFLGGKHLITALLRYYLSFFYLKCMIFAFLIIFKLIFKMILINSSFIL